MLKGIGALLIVLAPVLFSVSAYRAQFLNDRVLAAFTETLEFCAAQICVQRRALPELSQSMAQKGPVVLRSFWHAIDSSLQKKPQDFDQVWQRELRRTTLPPEAYPILDAYPNVLRGYDTHQVAQALRRMQSELGACRREKQRIFRRNFKTRTGLQVSAALLLLILLF